MFARANAVLVILCFAGQLAVLANLAPPATIGGTVKSVSADGKQITVTVGSGNAGKDLSFHITARTKITLDDKAAKLSDLVAGAKVTVAYDKDSKVASSIRAKSADAAAGKADTPGKSVAPGKDQADQPKAGTAGAGATRTAMSKQVDLELNDAPMSVLVDTLREKFGLNIVLDRVALEQAGVKSDTKVSARLTKANLETALESILSPLKLDWLLREDVILITSQRQAQSTLERRVYQLVKAADAAATNTVIKDITLKVAPNSWSTVGGPGAIARVPGGLVVMQSPRAHREIEKLRDLVRPVRTEKTQSKARGQAEQTLRQALTSPCTLDFAQTPLKDVLSFLRDLTKITIDVDEPALKAEGITLDTPVTIHVQTVPLESALKLRLGQLNLTTVQRSGSLLVTSQLKAAQTLETKSYKVSDLVSPAAAFSANNLARVIRETIAPNAWREVGGSSTIQADASGGSLEVQATQSIHTQIEELLDDLRQLAKRK